MNYLFYLLLTAVLLSANLQAQILPQPGAKLNYTQVMFEYPKVAGANQYIVQVAEDTVGSTFYKPVIEQKDSSTATLISGLQFGKKYKWRYTGIIKNKKSEWNGAYKFETLLEDSLSGSDLPRLNILVNDTNNQAGGIITVDCYHAAFDREGNQDWYLPRYREQKDNGVSFRNLRITPSGTVIFIQHQGLSIAKECNLSGDVLWRAPDNGEFSGDSTEHYHHDFKKLYNGNYMALSAKFLEKKIPEKYDSTTKEKEIRNGELNARMEYGGIVEYNPSGKLVWSWGSENYLTDEDLFAIPVAPDTMFPPTGRQGVTQDGKKKNLISIGGHLNGFSADSKNEYVYAGFRNLSRVVKIEKKTGKVVKSWGAKFPSGDAPEGNDFFNQQHDANIFSNGTIGVFNNNGTLADSGYASAVVFEQGDSLNSKIVWKYQCNFDTPNDNKSSRGGNVDELPNGNFLVCTGTNNRIFEITPQKKILWNAITGSNGGEKIRKLKTTPIFQAHYASSLYPCYFTAQTDKEVLTKNASSFNLKIFNEGTEDDAYTIAVTSTSQSFAKQLTTAVIPKAGSTSLEIKPNKQLIAGEKIEVTVRSITNPALERTVTLAYQ